MAIQFNCPYCTATIRVPDSAAGKQGSCPKCGTKLIVPKIAPPAQTAAEAPKPVAKTPSQPVPVEEPKPAADGNFPSAPPEDAPVFPDLQTEPPGSPAGPSIAQVVRKRAKRKGMNPLVPIALFGVVVAVLVFVMWESGPKLEGQLAGVELAEFTIPPATIDKTTVDLPPEKVAADLEEMQNDPPRGVRIPDWFEMLFQPEPDSLKVVIKKTSATEVFRVNTGTNPALREFFKQHNAEILKRQQAEFRPALKQFFKDWEAFHKADAPFETEAYRSSLGFNALGGPLGFCLEAKVGSRGYRCVHQDGSGDLYFLLPKQTESFVLSGRKLADGTTLFPGHYTVKVQGTKPASEPAPESETEETPPAEPAKTEPSKPETKPRGKG